MEEGQVPNPESQELEGTHDVTTVTVKEQDSDAEKFDAEYVKKLRSEAAANRKKAKEAEERLKAIEDAQMTEQEKLKRQAEESSTKLARVEAELRQERSRVAISRAASEAGVPVALAEKLVDVEYDDDGKITTDLKRAMSDLIKQYPQLTLTSGNGGSPTNPARSGQGEPKESDEQKRRRLYGGAGLDVFDPDVARAHGGGVIFDHELNVRQRE